MDHPRRLARRSPTSSRGSMARLVEVLGDAELSNRTPWRDNASRVQHRDELRGELNRIFVARSTEEWLHILRRTGVPHAPILDVAGAFGQEQIRDGDFVGPMTTPGGEVSTMRTPLVIDGTRPNVRRGPRRMGEDSHEIFGD